MMKHISGRFPCCCGRLILEMVSTYTHQIDTKFSFNTLSSNRTLKYWVIMIPLKRLSL